MPLFDESVAFAGLSKSSDMSGFIVKPVFPYGGAHFSYHPRGKDAAEFTTPWTNSSAASPTHQASGAKTGGDNSSLPDSPVYLAIPKALYLHNPCCHDLACVMRHRYNMEHGQTAALNADLEHNRSRGEPYHSPRSGIHQKAQDNPRDLQSDSCEEQIKRMTAESLTGGRSSRTEPNYSGYPCMPPLAMLASLSEQRRHLQPPPRGFAAFPPTHATYEHMTSELYQECSPMSKYGHPTKQPMFYYPQANVEVKHRTHSRDIGGEQREDVPVIRTSAIPSPREYYTFPPTLQGDIPLFFHGTETQPNHSFVHGLGYRCYAHPGFQIRNVEQQHVPTGLPSHRLILPGSDQRPSAAAAVGLQKSEQHVGPSEPSHVLLRMEPFSPTRPVLPPHFEINSLYPSITSRLDRQMERPVISPSGMTQDRPLDFSSYVSQIKPEHRKDFPVSPRTRLPQSPKQTSDCRSKLERLITTDKVNGIACGYADSVLKEGLKRRFPSLLKIKLEEPDSYEIDLTTKRRKSDTKRKREDYCPQMPVIGSVFSLAQEYLNAPEAFRSQVEPQRGAQLTDHCQIIPTTALKGIKPDPNGAPHCMCPEKCEVQMMEPTKIKVAKINQSDPCEKSPSPAASSAIRDQIKPQPEDATLSDTKSMLATQICEPEKLERQLLSAEVSDASQSPKVPRSLENDKTPQEQVAETELKPLKAANFNITSIPLEHLKLCPSYDIRLHRPAAQQEPPAQIQAETSPVRQAAVRKRFVELHRTLCKRVSKRVSATSEQQLTTWRSQLELAEPSSNKVQNVSSLLGIQARDKWLNEEINSALDEVLDRFREYIIHERCPFPHVMRTGAVFLPMLVVKEILFPEVPVTFIDQVLQEHKVQLRPTTLSEEKILTQLHKPCSSRLRRLMSLKHLPDVYADVLNLLYYSNVCKHLGVDVKTWEGSNISGSCSTAEDTKAKSHKRSATKTKSRVKSSSRRLFLDDSLSDEDNHSKKHIEKESGNKTSSEDASPSDDSWTHPLTCEDFPGSGVEPEESSGSPDASRDSSGMIVKLKREEAERRCVTFKWQRTGRRGRNLRPLSGSRKPKTRSLLKIKYCPYLSTCHSAERRRRWVLRSAVRRARGAMKLTYPDLEGKKIRHLYEEDDKSEVWYCGEVLGVHEAHSDPLKTIFEVRYDSEPEWKYYLELLIDYQKGWLIIEEDN